MKCGLLGRKLVHSYSPQIHSFLGEYAYDLFEKEPEDVKEFVLHGDYAAMNVTIPYKKDVIPFLDELSPTAQKMGSVNTVVRRPDGTLFGHNTDYFGFVSLVRHSGIAVENRKVLVLGSGGTSNTAVRALKDLGAEPVVISRSGKNSYENLHLHADAAVIVNTTPVGMYPKTGIAPLDLGKFPCLEGVLDVIYNPARTQLLLDAEKRGLKAENGLWMLVAQAKEAAEYFTGGPLDDGVIAAIHRRLSVQMQNIALIGMPGCGKSTVGQLLAQKLGRRFVDADSEIVALAGKSIPQIFAEDGEEAFRTLETRVLAELGKQSGLVIATGGGCITRERNFPLLHQNSSVVWIKRNLDLLATHGRPLSRADTLGEMYRIRSPLYETFSDFSVWNSGSPQDTAEAILARLEEKQ